MSDALLPVIAVGCFTCRHVERALEPVAAHDAMERHYASAHASLIARLAGDLQPLPNHVTVPGRTLAQDTHHHDRDIP